jgi:glycerate 2-kinase
VGIARDAALEHVSAVARVLRTLPRPVCVLSAGETTVHVTGGGAGGRNQEFALAMANPLASMNAAVAAASVGTDGIDGPTDAAGAIIDRTTLARAAAAGIQPDVYLNDNNSYVFFQTLNDLIRIGPTDTNVGDLQVVLVRE